MTSSCPCHPQHWPTAVCPFSTASWLGCNSLPVQLSDATNTCSDPLIWRYFPLVNDSTRTAERELQVILFGRSSTLFLPYFRKTASSLLHASLHPCPKVAVPRALQPPVTTAAPRSTWAHKVPALSLWPARKDRLVHVWIQFPALAGSLADH